MSNISSNQLDNLHQLNNLYSLEVYYSQANNRPRLPKLKWDKLSNNAKRAWIALDIESKRIIRATDKSSTGQQASHDQNSAIKRQGFTHIVQFHNTHDDQGINNDNNTDTDTFYDASSRPTNNNTSHLYLVPLEALPIFFPTYEIFILFHQRHRPNSPDPNLIFL